MKKFTKGLLLVLCAAVLVAGSIMGTLAWLTDTKEISNTFTVGKVAIELEETTSTNYTIVPGMTAAKDPTVTVLAGSERCYLFVKVENGIANLEVDGATSIASQMAANKWKTLDGVEGVYYYESTVASSANDQEFPVFASFKIKEDADKLGDYKNTEIKITAYAVQAVGFDDASEAWAETFGATAQNP